MHMDLASIQPASFHRLSWQQQVAILHNVTQGYYGRQFITDLADHKKLNHREFRIVSQLLAPHFMGPFFSTFLEGPHKWKYYVNGATAHEIELFQQAVDYNLWAKYVGLEIHHYHGMGELVHSLITISDEELASRYIPTPTFTPGIAIPAYLQGIASHARNAKNVRFVGAFSPISVQDIWLLAQYMGPNTKMEITDIQGCLPPVFASHYGLPFTIQNALEVDTVGSLDAIFTNSLLDQITKNKDEQLGRGNLDLNEMRKRRRTFFEVCYQLLTSRGSIVLAEHPLIDWWHPNISQELQAFSDKQGLIAELQSVGFTNICVEYAPTFRSRKIAARYTKTRANWQKGVTKIRNYGSDMIFLICATKA